LKVFANAKNSGHRRTNPSAPTESVLNSKELFKCSWKNCEMALESQGLLTAHMKTHTQSYDCEFCDKQFLSESEFKRHMTVSHVDKQWNCNNCSFQASSSKELINHLKMTGHQPSKTIDNQKAELKKCYTCKEEFSSYWNLMNHRKQKHHGPYQPFGGWG
jgi:cyclopropane fatty-acyl-phospholipid synthase-like methyltransferase